METASLLTWAPSPELLRAWEALAMPQSVKDHLYMLMPYARNRRIEMNLPEQVYEAFTDFLDAKDVEEEPLVFLTLTEEDQFRIARGVFKEVCTSDNPRESQPEAVKAFAGPLFKELEAVLAKGVGLTLVARSFLTPAEGPPVWKLTHQAGSFQLTRENLPGAFDGEPEAVR